jgi:hypothetical protein
MSLDIGQTASVVTLHAAATHKLPGQSHDNTRESRSGYRHPYRSHLAHRLRDRCDQESFAEFFRLRLSRLLTAPTANHIRHVSLPTNHCLWHACGLLYTSFFPYRKCLRSVRRFRFSL